MDSESIVAYVGIKTLQYSIKGGLASQVYLDSTFAIPIQGNKRLLVNDFRMGREGLWIVSLDALGRQTGEAKKIVPSGVNARAPQDQRYWIYRKGQGNELWRVWTSTGKEERFGKALPGQAYMRDVGNDGKEILWIRFNNRSKLVLVKNVFE